MNKIDLKIFIHKAFKSVECPIENGFQEAVEKKEYNPGPYTKTVKLWSEISIDDMKKHYDFILFLENEGFIYYTQTYLNFLLDNPVFSSKVLAGCFLFALQSNNLSVFSKSQSKAIIDTILYCRNNTDVYEEVHDEEINDVIAKMRNR